MTPKGHNWRWPAALSCHHLRERPCTSKSALQTRRRRAGECLILVQFQAQIVVTNAGSQFPGGDGERHFVFARLQQRGVERLGVFMPHAPVRVIPQGIGGDGPDAPTALPLTPMARPPPSAPPSAILRVALPCAALSMLNLMVQVVARPRPNVAPHILARCVPAFTQPKRWLAGSFAAGFSQAVDCSVRHLLEEPVLVIIALADGVSDVVGEQERVAHSTSPRASSRCP